MARATATNSRLACVLSGSILHWPNRSRCLLPSATRLSSIAKHDLTALQTSPCPRCSQQPGAANTWRPMQGEPMVPNGVDVRLHETSELEILLEYRLLVPELQCFG